MVPHCSGCMLPQKHCIPLSDMWSIIASGFEVRGCKVEKDVLLDSSALLKTYSKKRKRQKKK